MRRACQNVDFIGDKEKDDFIGISLGYDYCAEHEWGIKGIKYKLGMPIELEPNNFGLTYRTITKFEENQFTFFKTEKKFKGKTYKFAILIFDGWGKYNPESLPRDLSDYHDNMIPGKWYEEDREIITAWDGDSFGIIVCGERAINCLDELFEAFKKKDICIGLFGGGAFANAHLTIAIKSKMPEDVEEDLKKNDLESFETSKLRKKWEEKVEKSGKKKNEDYYAISPRFFNFQNPNESKEQMEKYNTKYNFHIWVNGSNDNYGWFTGEQIETWMKSDKQLKEFKN
jgi:hypothetical protein